MPNVRVFSTPTCPYCIRAKNYLKEKNVPFENIDVSVDQNAVEQMVKISGQMAVPVIVVDNDVIVGFDKARLDAKLGLS